MVQEYERAVIFRWKENYDFKTFEHSHDDYHKDYDESNELDDDKMTTMMVKMQMTNKARPIAPWRSARAGHLLHHPVH